MSELNPLDFAVHALRVNGGAPCDIEAADLAAQELHALREDRATIDAMTTLLGEARSERDALRAELTRLREEHEKMLDASTHGQMGEWLLAERTRLRESYRDATAKGADLALRVANQAVEIDEKDRRIAELEAMPEGWKVHSLKLEAVESERDSARATIAAQGAALLAMREALVPWGSGGLITGTVLAWISPQNMTVAKAIVREKVVVDNALHATAPAAQEAERRVLERAWERVQPIAKIHLGTAREIKAAILGISQDPERSEILGTQRAVSEANTDQPTQPQS